MIRFTMLDPRMTDEHLGFIPYYFQDNSVFDAEEQMNFGYMQTAGSEPGNYPDWMAQHQIREDGALKYPGDPWVPPLADYKLTTSKGVETLRFYDCAIFTIQQEDGSFKVWRLD